MSKHEDDDDGGEPPAIESDPFDAASMVAPARPPKPEGGGPPPMVSARRATVLVRSDGLDVFWLASRQLRGPERITPEGLARQDRVAARSLSKHLFDALCFALAKVDRVTMAPGGAGLLAEGYDVGAAAEMVAAILRHRGHEVDLALKRGHFLAHECKRVYGERDWLLLPGEKSPYPFGGHSVVRACGCGARVTLADMAVRGRSAS